MTLEHISLPIARVISRFPFERTVDRLPNDPKLEWIFSAVEGMAPARAKRLIWQARSPEVAFLDDAAADIAMDALGIREA